MRRLCCIAVAVAVTALGLSACGDSDDESYKENPDLKKSMIVIGMANATTGPLDAQQAAANVDVAKAWEEWVNFEQGGINGHPVKVVIQDTKNDPATSTTAANKLIRDEKVIAQVGGADSVSASVWVPLFNEAKIPVIGGQLVDDKLYEYPYYYPTILPVSQQINLMMEAAKTSGAASITGVVCAEAPSCKQAEPGWKGVAERLGMTWEGLSQVRMADANYTAPCLAMKDTGADYIQLGVSVTTAVRVVKDCHQQGLTSQTFGIVDGAVAVQAKSEGAKFVGVSGGFPFAMDNAAVATFGDVMTKYGDGVPKNSIQGDTWNGLEMFRKAMANASDNPTSVEVAESLSKIKNEDLGGLLPQKISYSPVGQRHTPPNCAWSTTYTNGKPSDMQPQCPTP